MRKNKLDIVYEDKWLIVINKPAHLLTIGTDKEKEKTLYHEVLTYEKRKNKNNKIFIVHRLDKDTSGIIIFAKSMEIKNKLQDNWDKFKRGYVALVHGNIDNKGTIKSYLAETKTLQVYETNDSKKGKLAITSYEKVKDFNKLSLIKIQIKTGRKHQIRVQLSGINHEIVGDKKYGKNKFDPLRRLCLHANYLEIMHPAYNKVLVFSLDIPKEFKKMVDDNDGCNK